MSNPSIPDPESSLESTESTESFDTILSQYEQTHSHRSGEGGKQLSGTVVAVTVDSVIVDIGYKTEGVLPLAVFRPLVRPWSRVRSCWCR